jgi:hypothetical protein
MTLNSEFVFVPFWVILDYLDSAKYEPFIECRIIKQYSTNISPVEEDTLVYDLEIKPDLIVKAVPVTYTIEQHELKEWGEKIANWFLQYSDNF